MADAQPSRSPELDQVRQMLFPRLTAEEGWARIDEVLEAAADPERIDRIERAAAAE
jgi:hypothetical protein